jgi:hypothetical protein
MNIKATNNENIPYAKQSVSLLKTFKKYFDVV